MLTNDSNELKEPNKMRQEIDDTTQIKYYGGHEFDGIKELDNPMPPWLKYLFYVTIIIAATYLIRLTVFKDETIVQRKEYNKEMAIARAKTAKAEKEEASKEAAKPMTQEQILAAGKVTFDKICYVCHGKFGEGLVGPNFTDEYWIHGNKPEDLKKAKEFFSKISSIPDIRNTWFQLAVCIKENSKLIGDIGIHYLNDDAQVEIEYTIAPIFQRNGYSTEALIAVIQYLFYKVGKHRIIASVDPRN